MSEKSLLSRVLHDSDDKTPKNAGQPLKTVGELNGNNSVSEWLDHPVGGALVRDMLQQAGQNESALRPVRRLSMKRLITMSRGQFTDEMLDDMIAKVKTVRLPSDTPPPAETPELQRAAASQPEWQETITPDRFAGKTVVVTGAGSGIGRATASRIAREGGQVIAVDISRERLDEFVKSLPDTKIKIVAGDITSEKDVRQIVEAAGDQIDGLANVAGIMDNMTPIHEVSDEIWDRVMAVNVTGMMKLSRAVIPKMLSKNIGNIVNVASEASLRGSAAGVAYTTSKHAVIGLTKSSAFMYANTGLRINAVAPGPVLTNIEVSFDSELGSQRVNALLAVAPEAAEADMLAASITFLLSDDSINLNGIILPSDGGWSAQ